MSELYLARVQPEAKPIVEAASQIYVTHVRPWLVGLVLHGSALKGGFIPQCSDIDLQLYLDEAAFTPEGQLPLDICLSIQQELAQIDPSPFQYIQCYALPPHLPANQVGPIPGGYAVLLGRLPVPEATEEQVRSAARRALDDLIPLPDYVPRDLLQHGGGKLERSVRLLCTDVWPTLYQVLTLQQQAGLQVWCLPKEQAIAQLSPTMALGQTIRAFYGRVYAYYTGERSVETALQVISCGVAFLRAAKDWWQHNATPSLP
jgi:hypothetical protein